jgi:glycosyltransferase involved in cell wall biosynthesis
MNEISRTHVVIIPSYNTGAKVFETVRNARSHWAPVWVVVDGSNDGTAEQLKAIAAKETDIRVFVLPENRGKGAAVLHGLEIAAKERFTHALTMDADGQHPAEKIAEFMAKSMANSNALILGLPQFDTSAPSLRVRGRKVSNWWANLETCWQGIGDSLFGFRVYPIKPLLEIMQANPWMRRFDFDVEAAVRLVWRGVPPINLAAPVKYFNADEGGVSHFNYVRDNALLTWMHTRLFCGFIVRLPWLLWLRRTASSRLRKQH